MSAGKTSELPVQVRTVTLFESLGAAVSASGDGRVDWSAVANAAKAATEPGSIDLLPGEAEGYANDVREARRRVQETTGLGFDLPGTVKVQNRHHWIDANVGTFRAVLAPLEGVPVALPGVARRVNTATLAVLLAFLSRHVLGQYDPVLLAEGDRGLYFVRPNLQRAAADLRVDHDAFRRWIVVHEVTHAAQFDAAPWLASHLEAALGEGIEALAAGRLDREALAELDAAMTAVEGYAEFVMDRALDGDAGELRAKLDARRRRRGPLAEIASRLLGLDLKRRQYKRGRAFFEEVEETAGTAATAAVWDRAEALPTPEEIGDPEAWLHRVRP